MYTFENRWTTSSVQRIWPIIRKGVQKNDDKKKEAVIQKKKKKEEGGGVRVLGHQTEAKAPPSNLTNEERKASCRGTKGDEL